MEPVTAALVVGAIAAVASTAVSTTAAVQAGQDQQKAANFKAAELTQQAKEAQQESGIKLAAQDQKATQVLASIRATSAAAGVNPDTGSPKEVFETSSEQAQINDMYTKYAGNLAAQGLDTEAALTTYGGENAKTAAYYTGAGDVISGVGQLAKIGYTKWSIS